MQSLNRVILIGRLGGDPEDRLTTGGTRVSNFRVATDHFRAANGTPQKTTEWHRIVAFGKVAECCNQYLKKGRLVCVEGALQTRSWEKPPGEKHFTTEIIASQVAFLDSRATSAENPEDVPGEAEAPF